MKHEINSLQAQLEEGMRVKRDIFSFTVMKLRRRDPEEDGGEGVAQLGHAEEDLRKVKEQRVASLIWLVFIFISRLTKSAKKEAEDWARQTKRTLVMEMIKQRKHTWISRPKRQV